MSGNGVFGFEKALGRFSSAQERSNRALYILYELFTLNSFYGFVGKNVLKVGGGGLD